MTSESCVEEAAIDDFICKRKEKKRKDFFLLKSLFVCYAPRNVEEPLDHSLFLWVFFTAKRVLMMVGISLGDETCMVAQRSG